MLFRIRTSLTDSYQKSGANLPSFPGNSQFVDDEKERKNGLISLTRFPGGLFLQDFFGNIALSISNFQ